MNYTKKSTYINGFRGKKQSESAKQKIREKLTGFKRPPMTDEHRLKLRLSHLGKKGGSGKINPNSWEQISKNIWRLQKNECRICKTTERLTINHIIPKTAGGKNIMGNLEILCLSCNVKEYHRIVKVALKYYYDSLS